MRDFIDNVCESCDTERIVAGKIVEYFCFDDGEYDANQILPLALCIKLMTEEYDIPSADVHRAVADLKEVAPLGKEQVIAWAAAFE
jgi:hypothetical protein